MIEIKDLCKSYGKQSILQHINVKFVPGNIYGLVGPNGCGKTTLMKCICGFAQPTSGEVWVDQKRIGKDVDFASSTGMIIESPGFLAQLSGLRNLLILANISGKIKADEVCRFIQMLGLDPNDKKPVGKYSLGMKQRLGIAQAIMEDPENLILDEPFNGLDKQGIKEVHALLKHLKEQKKTIILASHSAFDIEQACDVVYEMQNGQLAEIVQSQTEERNFEEVCG